MRNLRQGGARNLGFRHAKGDYLLNIDDDDALSPDTFKIIDDVLKQCDVDVLMLDNNDVIDGVRNQRLKFEGNMDKILSGTEYLASQQVSWTPWSYVINRSYLQENNLSFCENVLYEDVDFCLCAVTKAGSVKYIRWPGVLYSIRAGQTSKIGNSKSKIEDLLRLTERLQKLANSFDDIRRGLILAYFEFQTNVILTRYLWRLKFIDIVELLNKYDINRNSQNQFTKFAFCYPIIYASIAKMFSPIVNFGLRLLKVAKDVGLWKRLIKI